MKKISNIFKDDFPKEECVHIIIKAPEPVFSVHKCIEFDEQAEQYPEMDKKLSEILLSKNEKESIIEIAIMSRVTGPQYRDFLSSVVIRKEAITIQHNPITKTISEFNWGSEDEASYIDACTVWLSNFVTIPEGMELYCASEYLSGSGGAEPGAVGPEHILALPKVDIMKWLPSPDIGDMRDFFDEMSEKERKEWNARYALNCVM
ncbi:hypothetical protein EV426DRAFT_668012 [Tirmania nivea]|nr:hypothetical protein EV426DRAFT_668012 [Tirmania nivea]